MRWSADDLAVLQSRKNLSVSIQNSKEIISQDLSQTQKAKPKSAKYRNTKVYVYRNGLVSFEKNEKYGEVVAVYDSNKEYKRYLELCSLEKAGKIRDLKAQVPIIIQPKFIYNGTTIQAITYKADFCYREKDSDVLIIEDVKAFDTAKSRFLTTKDFNLKWKLLKYQYPQYDFRLF